MKGISPPIVEPVDWLYGTLWNSEAYQCTLYKQAFCPCGSSLNPNRALTTCNACHGWGWIYPFPPQKIQGLVSDVKMRKDLLDLGLAMPGDLLFSPAPGMAHLSDYDLILLPWKQGVPSEGQIIQRGGGPTDKTYYRMDWVQGVWTVDPATGGITQYVPNVDFTWQGNEITWTGNQPSQGTYYSIQYSGMFEWICFVSPQPRIAFGRDLGQRVILRKRHVVDPNSPLLVSVN